ncbi:MAG: TetR/AcrR family transcriptional regulator [Desulfatibacillaceae bacterium]
MATKQLAELRQEERDTRRRLILDAARELFATRDFTRVTAREIAKAAGMGIGTLYHYYRNLDELFLDVFLMHALELRELIDSEGGTAPSLPRLCRLYLGYLNDNMTFYQMMSHFMLGGVFSEEGTVRLDEVMRSLMDTVEEALKARGMRENSRITAHALFAALNGVMISYARYPGRTTEQVRAHTMRLADVIAETFALRAEG